MSNPLHDIREAWDIAFGDLADVLREVRDELKRLGSPALNELISRIDGDVHELALLHRREVHVLSSGRDLNPANTEAAAP